MPFWGPIINLVKGVTENISLTLKLNNITKEIEEYKTNIDKYAEGLEPLDGFLVKNNLLMAEYFYKRDKYLYEENDLEKAKECWERVKMKMDNNLAEIERQLMEQNATKLDIAKLLAGITKISGEIDMEFNNFKTEIFKNIDKFKNEVNDKISKLDKLESEVEKSFREIVAIRQQVEEDVKILKMEYASLKSFLGSQIDDVNTRIQNNLKEIEKLKIVVNNKFSEFESYKLGILSQIYNLEKQTSREIEDIKSQMKKNFEEIKVLTQQLRENVSGLQKEYTALKSLFDSQIDDMRAEIKENFERIKELKKYVEDKFVEFEGFKDLVENQIAVIQDNLKGNLEEFKENLENFKSDVFTQLTTLENEINKRITNFSRLFWLLILPLYLILIIAIIK